MRPLTKQTLALAVTCSLFATAATAETLCTSFGPQTPRDISSKAGTNPRTFTLAPDASKMNLCDIHTHTNAEHKGPGFSVFVGDGKDGGFQCNETDQLTEAELKDPGELAYHGVKPGDTIEVHWVYTSCEAGPGPGLGSCLTDSCANPQLRVEAQVFLVVNDPDALDRVLRHAFAQRRNPNGEVLLDRGCGRFTVQNYRGHTLILAGPRQSTPSAARTPACTPAGTPSAEPCLRRS